MAYSNRFRSIASALVFCLVTATPAFAQSEAGVVGLQMPEGASETKQATEVLVESLNRLGIRTLGELEATDPDHTHLLSPVSLAGALSLLSQGEGPRGDGGDLSWLLEALGADDAMSAATGWRGLATALIPRPDSGLDLSLAGGLWHSPGRDVAASVVKRFTEDLGATVSPLDFTAPDAAATINDWVSEATRDRIPSIMDRLAPETELVVASALAFSGSWRIAFDQENTMPLPFTTGAGQKLIAPTMVRSGTDLLYAHAEGWDGILLPYADSDFALVIALSVGDEGVSPWPATTDWLAPEVYQPHSGEILLPKLDLRSTVDLTDMDRVPRLAESLRKPLTLSGLGPNWGQSPVVLGQAVQAISLHWDESGTEAAAATVFSMARGLSDGGNNPFLFQVDRPFAFALLHQPTKAILIAGVVKDLGSGVDVEN